MARISKIGRKRGQRDASSSGRHGQGSHQSDIYQEMLEEAGTTAHASVVEEGRSVKKRRIGGRLVVAESTPAGDSMKAQEESADFFSNTTLYEDPAMQRQTVHNESEASEESDDDDDWEEIDLQPGFPSEPEASALGDLDLTLQTEAKTSERDKGHKRKILTATERELRLGLHKMHILALLYHCHLRNQWCNDSQIQTRLKKLLPKSVLKYFDENETHSQFQKSRSLTDGLEKASEIFRQHFKITSRGLSRSYWAESPEVLANFQAPDDVDLPLTKTDFQALSENLSGSRDSGAQLYCALLRSVGLEVRLVSSLQSLPFSGTTKTGSQHHPTPLPRVVYPETREGMKDEESDKEVHEQEAVSSPSTSVAYPSPHAIPRRVQRFGQIRRTQPASRPPSIPTLPKPSKKRIRESPFPIFWVEVFNEAIQKWIAVDPLVTKTIAKHSKLDPPANDAENNMSYVIAFEEDGYAKDVTRRYAKAYNAKTRRSRVEFSKGGSQWWKRIMRMFRSSFQLDRDQVESAELAAKEAQESMPRNINEFHKHPYYALERHLHKNEVIHPKRQVGKVSAGQNKPLEGVYRRSDVHVVKCPDSWFRVGREVRSNEEPLKYHKPRRRDKGPRADLHNEDEEIVESKSETDEVERIPMYAAFQTQQYCPPPISNGLVPKNMYGNIDVYTPTMIPAGGVWISHPFAAGASKLLGIDYADAVTGFSFKGRTGTAVVNGVVLAGEYHDAVVETIKGFEHAFEEEEAARRTDLALRTWKRFLIALRIRQRIDGYVEGSEGHDKDLQDDESEDITEDDGGFLPDSDAELSEVLSEGLNKRKIESNAEGSGPLAKALRDAKAPIISTWGKPNPSASSVKSTPLHEPSASEPPGYNPDPGGFFSSEIFSGELGGGFLPEDEIQHTDFEIDTEGKPPANHDDTIPTNPSPEPGGRPRFETPRQPGDLHDPLEAHSPPPVELGASVHGADDGTDDGTDEGKAASPIATSADRESPPSKDEEATTTPKTPSEHGSLLSHDPDDEEATPEWLA